MPGHDIIVIGASAGGIQALQDLIRPLPADLPAALFVVVHFPAMRASVLPAILERAGSLPTQHAIDQASIRHGRIYVAPPDQHLLIERGKMVLTRGPRENGHRPAIDPLFRTAARTYGPRIVGVVLSGGQDDGTAGMVEIHRRGGTNIVQDPREALVAGMPLSAINNDHVDHVLPIREIARQLIHLARSPVASEAGAVPENGEKDEPDRAEMGTRCLLPEAECFPTPPSVYTCPECSGVLWEVKSGELTRFQCHVGHSYAEKSLLTEHADMLESALWTALRALEERISLMDRVAERATKRGEHSRAKRFREEAEDTERRAAVIRDAVIARGPEAEEGAE